MTTNLALINNYDDWYDLCHYCDELYIYDYGRSHSFIDLNKINQAMFKEILEYKVINNMDIKQVEVLKYGRTDKSGTLVEVCFGEQLLKFM